MKFDITKYVAAYGVCQMVKAEHKRACRFIEASRDSRAEVRAHHYGFYSWFTSHSLR
jgi:hypothetical protein